MAAKKSARATKADSAEERPALSREVVRATYEAQRKALGAALDAAGLGARIPEFGPLIRDTIAITLRPAGKAGTALGATRLGGAPDLPADVAWPEVDGQALNFVGQFRLDDLAPYDIHDQLPADGLLSIFVGVLVPPGEEPVVEARVLHTPTSAELHAVKPPSKPFKAMTVELAPLAMLPPYGSKLVKWDDAYQTFYDELYQVGSGAPRHGLLGFDRPLEGALSPEDALLLRLDAVRDVPYDFVEAATLYVVMPVAALAARNFGAARAIEGASI